MPPFLLLSSTRELYEDIYYISLLKKHFKARKLEVMCAALRWVGGLSDGGSCFQV